MAGTGANGPVSSRIGMIRGMRPRLSDNVFAFVTVAGTVPECLRESAISTFVEDEGLSLIVPVEFAPDEVRMRLITLTVHSSLEGVGLTAAVSQALASENIPANVVAAYHHDHVFVPEALADQALTVLQRLARASG